LARKVRFFVKKRGDRRTSSSAAGTIGEGVFFGLLLLFGLVGLGAGVVLLLAPEWRANHQFVRHTCRVLDKRVASQEREDGVVYRPEVQIEYQVGEQTFRIWTYDVATAIGAARNPTSAGMIRPIPPWRWWCAAIGGGSGRCWWCRSRSA